MALAGFGLASACGEGSSSLDGGGLVDGASPIDGAFDAGPPRDAEPLDGGGPVDALPPNDTTPSNDAAPNDAEGTLDALPVDASPPDAAAPDAGLLDAGLPSDVLLVVGGAGDSVMPPHALSFRAGVWSAAEAIPGGDHAASGGGGVTMLRDGRGLAVLHTHASVRVESALWTGGTWDTRTDVAAMQYGYMAEPVTTPTGALVAMLWYGSGGAVTTGRFDAAAATWTIEPAGFSAYDYFTTPALAASDSGDSLLLVGGDFEYLWSQRISGTWTARAAVPGIVPPRTPGVFAGRALAAVALDSPERFVAAFTESAAGGLALVSATLEGGEWSATTLLASDIARSGRRNTIAMTALPDGRIALVYVDVTDHLWAGFYDGSTWSAFRGLTTDGLRAVQSAFDVTRGVDGAAIVEVVFVDGDGDLLHTRLTDETTWTWTAPVMVDRTISYASVHAAVGP